MFGNYMKTEVNEFIYDEYGNNINIIEKIFDNLTTYYKKTRYIINVDTQNWYLNRIKFKRVSYFLNDTLTGVINKKEIIEKFDFDQNTRLLLKKIFLPDEKEALETKYTYNKNGNVLSVTQKDLQTFEYRKKSSVYDQNGNVIIATYNELMHKTSFVYDEYENLVETIDSNGCKTIHKYDETGIIHY
jgi:YD repeat-containing protein